MTSTALTARSRERALQQMSDGEGVDILVIGGGVTGAGIALDAATRGLRVAIVEAQDWAGGTSAYSSKLVHGGLRYLYNFDISLVAEALRERGLLINRIAPHLVKPQPFLWPLKNPVVERTYSAVGVGMYDMLAQIGGRGRRVVPGQKHYSKDGAKALFPDLKDDALAGAIRFHDARVDDARLVIDLVRTAAGLGALAASRTQVTGITKDADGQVTGATVRDLEGGRDLHINARYVVQATGVWTERTQDLAGTDGGLEVLASKGIHIVVRKAAIDGSTGVFVRTEKSVLFIIPWERYWIIGTTDTPWSEGLQHPVATSADIDYVLEHTNEVLERPIGRDDIIGVYAGLRPLLQPRTKDPEASTKVSREHTVTEVAPGMCAIAGGKLTTYRVMAEDAVDFAITAMEGKDAVKLHPCLTEKTPLVGGATYAAVAANAGRIATERDWPAERVEHLLGRYGDEIGVLLDMIDADPRLGEPLLDAPAYLHAEVTFAVTHEGALHLEDVLRARVRLDYEMRDRGLVCAPEIAAIMQPLLGWSDEQTDREITAYRERVSAEAAAEAVTTDGAAAAIRDRHQGLVPMLENSPVKG
ncbi:glycerol-3-phosphate dehydrogenase/oxidase [Blastococcus sp. Marseille-P5729]|uniref:glycerol-3-phosphate dehydrogenase/oxidase n=1 Tax=Blastococcus sp. Marseille-P5729 TaxID=2086582 RepID=UPI0018FE06A3|nr:glycerol-3-phosphate dehydrogenase/oxidase [Blastococcus sp. Marseille-P5729]